MIVVIQCAAGKRPDARSLRTRENREVYFVARPALVPPERGCVYARPDDRSDRGPSWRELLIQYNEDPEGNPLGLYQAHALYQNPAYQRLVDRYGMNKVFILSAGWGLIRSSFLTPNYDITFSAGADAYKRRRKSDAYFDLQMLPDEETEEVVFCGGRDYLTLFCTLTDHCRGQRTVFYNSAVPPAAPGCSLVRFETRTRTNWHYECANWLIRGEGRLA